MLQKRKTIGPLAGFLLGGLAACAATSPMTLNPAALTFAYQEGAATLPAAQTIQVQTVPAGVNFTVAVSGSPYNAAWLLVSASSGKSPLALKVQVNPTGLAAGSYTGTITVSATINSQAVTQNATVTLSVTTAPPTITATPAALNFTYTTGEPIPEPALTSAFLLSSSGSPLTVTLSTKGVTWLSLAPSGSVSIVGLLNTITVNVDPTGLAPKIYTGQISISAPGAANKTLTLTVTLTVKASPPVVTSTWPMGVILGSPATIATVNGSSFYATSTAAATGFTPATTVTVTDGVSTATQTFFIPVYQATATTLRLANASPIPNGSVGISYDSPLVAAGGTAPYTYSIATGVLPPGLSVSADITGSPSAAGTYQFVIQVTDSSTPPLTAFGQLELTIDPAGDLNLRSTVAAAPLTIGVVGSAYGPITLTAAGGTNGPYTWSATNLPPGLTLSSAGVLSGTPSTDGSGGSLVATAVSSTAMLVTLPQTVLTTAGILRIAVTTPAPGGGTSNEGQFNIYGPGPQVLSVTNSASLAQGTIAPGEVISIFGLGLGPQTLTIFDPSSPPIPTSLPTTGSATSVTINGTAAPILYTSATQLGVIVPQSATGSTAQIVVSYGALTSQATTVTLAPTSPGIYSINSSGVGQGAILNYNSTTGDYTINSSANAAAKGSTVVIYITGAGVTTNTTDNQLIPASPAVTPVSAPTLTIGGQSAIVLGAQAPPGSVPGFIQINATVPSTVTAGPALPVVVTVGGVNSQTGLTMAVK